MTRTIYVGGTPFKVEVVKDAKAMSIGLSEHKELKKGHGMIFDFGEPQRVTMNMFEMSFPLDMLFIDSKKKVVAVETMHPGEHEVTFNDIRYVLEVNRGEGILLLDEYVSLKKPKAEESSQNITIANPKIAYPGDKEKFENGGSFQLVEAGVKALPGKMHVLDDKGTVLMNIDGGERIFSIKHTEDLMKLAAKVKDGELEPEALGKLMSKIIKIQDTQTPEYVD